MAHNQQTPISCKLFGHKWQHCKCQRCGALRDEDHDWNGCTCSICGKVRNQDHNWYFCKCKICGKKRDENHIWDNRCVCSICGKKRDQNHVWDYCRCRVCGQKRDTDHKWSLCHVKCEICGASGTPTHNWIKENCIEKCSKCGVTRESHQYCFVRHVQVNGNGKCPNINRSDDYICNFCETPNACLQYPEGHEYWYKCSCCGKEAFFLDKEEGIVGGNNFIV